MPVLGGIAAGGGSHVGHHERVGHPVASTQVVPVAYGVGQQALGGEHLFGPALQRFVAQPVGKLEVAVLAAEGLVVVLGVVDVVHEQVHGVPVLLHDLLVAELLPYRPGHDDPGVGPSETHLFVAVLCRWSHSGESAQAVLRVTHVAHPLVEELPGVGKERPRLGECLRVCRPA